MKRKQKSVIVISLFLFSLTILITNCAACSQELQGAGLLENKRYQVLLKDPVFLPDYQFIFQKASENGYWIRIGHEPQVEYYQGAELCKTCDYQYEKDFFLGNRIYIDIIESTYAIYSTSGTAEIQAVGNSKDLEIYFEPGIDLDQQSAEGLVNNFLRTFEFLQDDDAEVQMDFIELPTNQIQVGRE
ncbi:MAG: hypothetical protein ABIJ65_13315 [Chloroflexota bacterium]